MMRWTENKEGLEALKKLGALEYKKRELHLQEHLGDQDYQYDANDLFEGIIKTVTDTEDEVVGEIKYTTKASEALD